MGSLERRLAHLEAMLTDMGEPNTSREERIASEALGLLPTEELRLVIAGLKRIRERYADAPLDTPIGSRFMRSCPPRSGTPWSAI
jgi:hypothetical protein